MTSDVTELLPQPVASVAVSLTQVNTPGFKPDLRRDRNLSITDSNSTARLLESGLEIDLNGVNASVQVSRSLNDNEGTGSKSNSNSESDSSNCHSESNFESDSESESELGKLFAAVDNKRKKFHVSTNASGLNSKFISVTGDF